jgi:hypothetical protein
MPLVPVLARLEAGGLAFQPGGLEKKKKQMHKLALSRGGSER